MNAIAVSTDDPAPIALQERDIARLGVGACDGFAELVRQKLESAPDFFNRLGRQDDCLVAPNIVDHDAFADVVGPGACLPPGILNIPCRAPSLHMTT